MSIHDWTRVDAGLFHDFHQDWIVELRRTLNAGRLPPGFTALTDQVAGDTIPDVPTLNRNPQQPKSPQGTGALAVAESPPQAWLVEDFDAATYARRANRIKIQHRHGRVVAVIEIVSPGNKSSRDALRKFVKKSAGLIRRGIHLLVVDLFPPSKRDPQGVHGAIWDELTGRPFTMPPGKNLTAAAYRAGLVQTAYVEPLAVGDALPSLPIFLTSEEYVPAPLEETYQTSWAVFPSDFKELLEPPVGNG